jgi:hypothetical protein
VERLVVANPRAAEVVKIRPLARLTGERKADALGVSPRAVDSL